MPRTLLEPAQDDVNPSSFRRAPRALHRDQRGIVLTLLLVLLLGLVGVAIAWATLRGQPGDEPAPESQLSACTLLADTAFLEGKSRLVGRLDGLYQRSELFPQADERLASGAMQGASYRVVGRGGAVPSGAALVDQPITVTSRCEASDGARATVVVTGRAATRSAFDTPFCACGDVTAAAETHVGFAADSSSDDGARLVLSANGDITLPSADVRGGVVAGGSLRGHGMPSGGSYAGGENELSGAAHVLPTPRPCRCDDTVVLRTEAPAPAHPAPLPAPPAPAAPQVSPRGTRGKGMHGPEAAAPPRAAAAAPSPDGCERWIESGHFAMTTGQSCELPAGHYTLERLQLDPGAHVTPRGPVWLELTGSGPFSIASGAIAPPSAPQDLVIESRTTAELLLAGGEWRALVFAPRARVTLGDGASFEGGLVSGALALGANTRLLADPRATETALYIADFTEDDWRAEPATSSTSR